MVCWEEMLADKERQIDFRLLHTALPGVMGVGGRKGKRAAYLYVFPKDVVMNSDTFGSSSVLMLTCFLFTCGNACDWS